MRWSNVDDLGILLKLVIADRISIFVDNAYANVGVYDGKYLLIASMLLQFRFIVILLDIPQLQLEQQR